jgi:ribosomal-protein-alanine N-acetyltransferase
VGLRIREYRRGDFDALWALDQECFEPGIAYSRAELMFYLKRKGAIALVAETEAGLAGFLVAEVKRAALGHIITIDVAAGQRRSRVGTGLMQAAEEHMRRAGATLCLLETAVDNRAAITFYQRHGYSVLKTIPRYYKGELDALLMGKRLEEPA